MVKICDIKVSSNSEINTILFIQNDLCQGVFVSQVFANIRLMETYNISRVGVTALLCRSSSCTKALAKIKIYQMNASTVK